MQNSYTDVCLVLDIGNVLCNMDFDPIKSLLMPFIGFNGDEIEELLRSMQPLHDLGLTTLQTFLSSNFEATKYIDKDVLNKYWCETLIPNKQIISIFDEFADENHGCIDFAITSNMGLEHTQLMKDTLLRSRFLKNCYQHFSCEVGARKPSKLYFSSFLDEFHREERNKDKKMKFIYLDDNAANVSVGSRYFDKSYLFDISKEHWIDDLQVILNNTQTDIDVLSL
jgi:hypothetical protein